MTVFYSMVFPTTTRAALDDIRARLMQAQPHDAETIQDCLIALVDALSAAAHPIHVPRRATEETGTGSAEGKNPEPGGSASPRPERAGGEAT